MQKFITFTALLACTAAAPGYLFPASNIYTVPYSKSTLTKASQTVDHGSTYIHTPLSPVVPLHVPSKTTVTKSNHIVNHGGLAVVHAPVLHYEDFYHTVPSIVNYHASVPVVHSSPVLLHSSPYSTVKTGDSAVSQQSSTVHETVHHLPLVTLHH